MLPHPELWRELTPGTRVVLWLGAFCVLAALWSGYFWVGPWQARQDDDEQLQRLQASLTMQRQQLWLREKALLQGTGDKVRRTTPFSALHFQSPDASLVSWKPDAKGGELILETHWSPLPALFDRLAEQEMVPIAFIIEPEGRLLRFTLRLEPFRER